MTLDRIHMHIRYAPEVPHWLTGEQAAQQFGPLHRCAPVLLANLAAACVIRRQFIHRCWYYHRDDVALVAATLACQARGCHHPGSYRHNAY
jgi:hypothetical protein